MSTEINITVKQMPDGSYQVRRQTEDVSRTYLGLYWSLSEAYKAIEKYVAKQSDLAEAEQYEQLAVDYRNRAKAARIRAALKPSPSVLHEQPMTVTEDNPGAGSRFAEMVAHYAGGGK